MDGITQKTRKGAGRKSVAQGMDVLNGIAWEKEDGRLFLTGKKWPAVYEVELVEIDNTDDQLRKARHKCIK
jgi:glutamine cyclotransferase